jgi:hypothetical protein
MSLYKNCISSKIFSYLLMVRLRLAPLTKTTTIIHTIIFLQMQVLSSIVTHPKSIKISFTFPRVYFLCKTVLFSKHINISFLFILYPLCQFLTNPKKYHIHITFQLSSKISFLYRTTFSFGIYQNRDGFCAIILLNIQSFSSCRNKEPLKHTFSRIQILYDAIRQSYKQMCHKMSLILRHRCTLTLDAVSRL